MIIALDEIKKYLRVDFDDDDTVIETIEASAEKLVMDTLRTDSLAYFTEDNHVKTAVLYATAYLYEHREDADHHALMLTLRALLFGNRAEVF